MKKVRPDPAGIPDRNTYGELREHAVQINALVSEVIQLPKITVGTTAPANPVIGDLWVDTN